MDEEIRFVEIVRETEMKAADGGAGDGSLALGVVAARPGQRRRRSAGG